MKRIIYNLAAGFGLAVALGVVVGVVGNALGVPRDQVIGFMVAAGMWIGWNIRSWMERDRP